MRHDTQTLNNFHCFGAGHLEPSIFHRTKQYQLY